VITTHDVVASYNHPWCCSQYCYSS